MDSFRHPVFRHIRIKRSRIYKKIRSIAERKNTSLKPHIFEEWQNIKRFIKRIETIFNLISSYLYKTIHAVRDAEFKLKLMDSNKFYYYLKKSKI